MNDFWKYIICSTITALICRKNRGFFPWKSYENISTRSQSGKPIDEFKALINEMLVILDPERKRNNLIDLADNSQSQGKLRLRLSQPTDSNNNVRYDIVIVKSNFKAKILLFTRIAYINQTVDNSLGEISVELSAFFFHCEFFFELSFLNNNLF